MSKDTAMKIVPRKLDLTFNDVAASKKINFILDNPLITAFVATMSGLFPEGEKQFIISVRNYIDQIKDETLQLEIKQFIQQEAYHAMEHNTFNKRFYELGWDVYLVERFVKFQTAQDRKRKTHAKQLAHTVAMEHLTASFANWLMGRSDLVDQVDPEIARILIWHSIEETEHKAVAFDVFDQCVGDRKMLHRSLRLHYFLFTCMAHVLTFVLVIKSKQLPKWKHIKEFFNVLHGERGLYKSIKPDVQDFYRKDFHPWNHDNKNLAEYWIKKLNFKSGH